MPTNPVSPITEAAVDRLTLGVDSPRASGTEPSFPVPVGWACFEAEVSGSSCAWCWSCGCFEAE